MRKLEVQDAGTSGQVIVHADDTGDVIAHVYAGGPERQAYARCFAAAPKLLERLKTHEDVACLGWNNRFNLPDCECGPCLDRAAIAKAEGK